MSDRPKFEEIDVERINIVEADGTVRFTLTNKNRMPDVVIDGQTLPGRQGSGAGFIYYNDDGDEMGGFSFGGGQELGGQGALFSFDGYKKDQCLMLTFEEGKGQYGGGLNFLDRADVPLTEALADQKRMEAMPPGPEQEQALKAMIEKHWIAQRMFVGRGGEGSAGVFLFDTKSRPRILMFVDANDEPHLQFMDAEGNVTYELPPKD